MRLPLLSLALVAAAPALADVELSFYGGWQGAPTGGVTLSNPVDGSTEEGLDGSGLYGLRATWWGEGGFGLGADFTRFGGDQGEGDDLSFGGLDVLTVNGLRRWDDGFGRVTPYVGAGLGIAMSEIEVAEGAGSSEAEVTGPAVSWMAGASLPISESWSVFGEYKGIYASGDADLDGAGTVDADTVTNSINLGVSFSF